MAVGIFMSTDFYRNALSMGGSNGTIVTMPYLIGWAVAVLAIWLCFRISFLHAVFYQSLTYVLEHMVFNLQFCAVAYGHGVAGSDGVFCGSACHKGGGSVAIYFILTKRLYKLDFLLEYKAVTALLAVINVGFTILLNNWFYNNGWFSEALHIVRVLLCHSLCGAALSAQRCPAQQDGEAET